MKSQATPSDSDDDALERETGFGWGWFIVLGVALIVLGAIAFLSLPPAGKVSVYAVGIVMLVGSIAQLGTTLLVPRRKGIGPLMLSAILYGAAGIFAIVNPTLAATPPTLLLACALIFSGIARIRLTTIMPKLPGWGWIAASGFVSLVCGFTFVHLLFASAVWRLGMALAADLTFQGAMVLAFGLALKANPRAISASMAEP